MTGKKTNSSGLMWRYRAVLCAVLLVCGFHASAQEWYTMSPWKFRHSNAAEYMAGGTNIDLLADLHNNGLLPDPKYIVSDSVTAWVEVADWHYETILNITDTSLADKLVLDRADTYADVYLNGSLLGKTRNAFIAYEFDLRGNLLPGPNTLRIIFHSPVKTDEQKSRNTGFLYPADSDKHPLKTSVYTRKPAYHFGWDFAPRKVLFGVQKIYLTRRLPATELDIRDHHLRSYRYEGNNARVEIDLTLNVQHPAMLRIIPYCGGSDGSVSSEGDTLTFQLQPGEQTITLPMLVKNARLWYPAGLGTPEIYSCWFGYSMDKGDWAIATGSCQGCPEPRDIYFGLRDIRLIRERDSIGETFGFVVNGKPVFATGFNLVGDNVDDVSGFSDFPALNMVRVWGGGNYGTEELFEYCDRHGILVWQDFAFANTMYPANDGFVENVTEEVKYQVNRLRKHPSLALWCGNNEVEVAWENWGWQAKYRYNKKIRQKLISDYDLVFKNLLPQLVKQHDSATDYLSSSPLSNWGKPGDLAKGDNHFWGVYHGEMPFEAYDRFIPRFASEYGMQSYPSIELLRKLGLADSMSIEHPRVAGLQKSYKGNRLLLKYMGMYGKIPGRLADFILHSQDLQAMALKTALNAHMLNSDRCRGTLLWQYNDVAPVASWSLRDIDGNKKAAYHSVAEKMGPVTLISRVEDDSVKVWLYRHSADAQPFGINVIYLSALSPANDYLKTEYLQFAELARGLTYIGSMPLSAFDLPGAEVVEVKLVISAMEGFQFSATDRLVLNKIVRKQ